jgi:hypothetical protein
MSLTRHTLSQCHSCWHQLSSDHYHQAFSTPIRSIAKGMALGPISFSSIDLNTLSTTITTILNCASKVNKDAHEHHFPAKSITNKNDGATTGRSHRLFNKSTIYASTWTCCNGKLAVDGLDSGQCIKASLCLSHYSD